MSSSGLTRGSLFCDEIPRSSRGMTQGLGILEFLVYKRKKPLGILDLSLGILEFYLEILVLVLGILDLVLGILEFILRNSRIPKDKFIK